MREEAELVGWKDFLEDRSEPDHIEALLVLGQLERARRLLEHLEWRGQTLPRPWIDATLPRARALILAREGNVAAALAQLEAAPEVDASVRACSTPARQGPARASYQPEVGGEGVAYGGARDLRAARLAVVGRAGSERYPPPWPPSSTGGRIDHRRTADRRAGCRRTHKSTGRRSGIREPEDCRGEPRARLPKAGDPVAGRARCAHVGAGEGHRDQNVGNRPTFRRSPRPSVVGDVRASARSETPELPRRALPAGSVGCRARACGRAGARRGR